MLLLNLEMIYKTLIHSVKKTHNPRIRSQVPHQLAPSAKTIGNVSKKMGIWGRNNSRPQGVPLCRQLFQDEERR